jgi:L,D-transpeptidase YcbB
MLFYFAARAVHDECSMIPLRRFRFTLVLLISLLAAASARSQALTPAGAGALRAIADAARNPDLRWPDFKPYGIEFSTFYRANGYSLAWVQGHRATPQALALIGLLKDAGAKGLDAEDYDASRWDNRLANLGQSPTEQDLVIFDTALTVSAMRYIQAVHVGRVNPKVFNFQLDVDTGPDDLADFLQTHVVHVADPVAEIQKLEPNHPGYKKLLALLPVYTAMAQKDDGGKFPVPAKTVVPGQPYAGLTRLGWFLQNIGDIPAGIELPQNPALYDGVLVDGVKHYQARHGEDVTGRLDARTIQELNTPPADRIRQIKLTLERWRWLPHSFPQPPVIVNLPDFRLRAMNSDGTVAFYKNVIVGKAYGHKSPVFEKEIEYVIFRPYWEVPPSIQRAEIVPHIEKDPGYLAKHNFQVITPTGEVVTEGAVSPETLAGLKSFHLMVRQKPGPTNSLGLVKIIFPNPDNVYLHGTDVPELFSQSVRDFSHGCVRVQNPADLVAWVLRNNPGWNLDRVTSTMNGNQDNVQVNLAIKIPVLIVYGTAAVNEENQVRFFDDIYGYDAELAKVLAKGYPYPQ